MANAIFCTNSNIPQTWCVQQMVDDCIWMMNIHDLHTHLGSGVCGNLKLGWFPQLVSPCFFLNPSKKETPPFFDCYNKSQVMHKGWERGGLCFTYMQFISTIMVDRSNKETPHSFKGQQLENKSLYRFVIYMSFLEKFLSFNLTSNL